MTKKAHRRERRLFAPRPAQRHERVGRLPGQLDNGHLLCEECRERDRQRLRCKLPPLNVCHHVTVLDDPDQHPEQSPIIQAAAVLVNASLSWAGMAHAPVISVEIDGSDVVEVACQQAGMTTQEARAWELYCAGFSVQTIAVFMDRQRGDADSDLDVDTVREYLRRGRSKLRKLANA